ncbi:hypothetical protein ABZP36_035308 [Zizania latifolia]
MAPRVPSHVTGFHHDDDDGSEVWEEENPGDPGTDNDDGSEEWEEENPGNGNDNDDGPEVSEAENPGNPGIHNISGAFDAGFVPVTSLKDIKHLVDHPERYGELRHLCIAKVRFIDAPFMLDYVRTVVSASQDKDWLIGNLAQLREITNLETPLRHISASMRRLLRLPKDNQVLDIVWDRIEAIKDAVARLPPLSNQQPDNLRDKVIGLLEGLSATLPLKPDGAASPSPSTEILSPKFISDLNTLEYDMFDLQFLEVNYPSIDLSLSAFVPFVEEQKPPYFRINGYYELMDYKDTHLLPQDVCIVSFKFSEATKILKELQMASEETGWCRWVGDKVIG